MDSAELAVLEILEHSSSSYGPRTWANAVQGDATVAFAVDFTTAGEKLTRKASADKYVGIKLVPGEMDTERALAAARLLYRFLKARDARVLNVAGNGIYTLARCGISQHAANVFVTSVIAKVHEHHPLQRVISGGQTGIDLAGAVAGVCIGVDTQVLLPRGYIQRNEKKVDAAHSHEAIRAQVLTGAAQCVDLCSNRATTTAESGPALALSQRPYL